MQIKWLTKIVAVALVCFTTFQSFAFDASIYTSTSKLATGKWVKIKVKNTGINYISAEEIASLGLNPSKVHVYGHEYGGEPISDLLSLESMRDDLVEIPSEYVSGRIVFYGFGAQLTRRSTNPTVLSSLGPNIPYLEVIENWCSKDSYYFLAESDAPRKNYPVIESHYDATLPVTDEAFDMMYIYSPNLNPAMRSQTFMTADMMPTGKYTCQYTLKDHVAGTPLVLESYVAAKVEYSSAVKCEVNGNPASTITNSSVNATRGQYYAYSPADNIARYDVAASQTLSTISVSSSITTSYASNAYLVRQSVNYKKHNIFRNGDSQMRAYYPISANTTMDYQISVTSANRNILAWNVNPKSTPMSCYFDVTENLDGTYNMIANPKWSDVDADVVIFDPASNGLDHAEIVSVIENQNLHGLETPEMVIITSKPFIAEAERLAQWHRDAEGMKVYVIDQEQIFNEFSQGTPDVGAYRHLLKMWYDRDPGILKYALFFGRGTYDNRNVFGAQNDETRLLIYEQPLSRAYYEIRSACTDDYFAALNDNASVGSSLIPVIGVGRIPVVNENEAKDMVDKILDYYNNDNLEAWWGRDLFYSDEVDQNATDFKYDCELNLPYVDGQIDIHHNKMYSDYFTKTPEGLADGAKNNLKKLLKYGAISSIYYGHGSPAKISYGQQLWTGNEALSETTLYPSFMFFGTCDVAPLDSDNRGIAELMFLKKDGGVIGFLGASRTVYDSQNLALGEQFFKSLYTLNEDGSYRSLGDAQMLAKSGDIRYNYENNQSYALVGDPAMRLRFPKKLLRTETVNGQPCSNVNLYPGGAFTCSGRVLKNDEGTEYSDFNGEAMVVVYEAANSIAERVGGTGKEYTVKLGNDLIGTFKGKCVNGRFEVSGTLPVDVQAQGANVEIQVLVYDKQKRALHGEIIQGMMNAYDASKAVTDNVAPVITDMYINDAASFREGDVFSKDVTLYASFSDNIALNDQTLSMANTVELLLDGSRVIPETVGNISFSSDKKTGKLQVNVTELTSGRHTLDLRITDFAGNSTSRKLVFFYNNFTTDYDVTAEEPEAKDVAIFNFDAFDLEQATVFVLDATGRLVWKGTTDVNQPMFWELNDLHGNRVPAGVYDYYAQIKGSYGLGASKMKKLVVLKQ